MSRHRHCYHTQHQISENSREADAQPLLGLISPFSPARSAGHQHETWGETRKLASFALSLSLFLSLSVSRSLPPPQLSTVSTVCHSLSIRPGEISVSRENTRSPLVRPNKKQAGGGRTQTRKPLTSLHEICQCRSLRDAPRHPRSPHPVAFDTFQVESAVPRAEPTDSFGIKSSCQQKVTTRPALFPFCFVFSFSVNSSKQYRSKKPAAHTFFIYQACVCVRGCARARVCVCVCVFCSGGLTPACRPAATPLAATASFIFTGRHHHRHRRRHPRRRRRRPRFRPRRPRLRQSLPG